MAYSDEKILYTHNHHNSTVETIKPRKKDYGLSDISAATDGQLYNYAIKQLNAYDFHIPNFLEEDSEEDNKGYLKRRKNGKR